MDDRPRIGLTSRTLPFVAADKPRPTETVPRTYVEAVEAAGGAVWILPNAEPEAANSYAEVLDGLLLTGGDDPHPHLFGEEPHPHIERVDERRDRFEIALLHAAARRDLPVLGVCRGAQLMNLARGGDIYQDIASQTGSRLRHAQTRIDDGPWHGVELTAGSRLASILGVTTLATNSFHHQAVRRVGEGLVACARTPLDGLIEAVEDPRREFFIGVQWHPELAALRGDPGGKALFAAFLAGARAAREAARASS